MLLMLTLEIKALKDYWWWSWKDWTDLYILILQILSTPNLPSFFSSLASFFKAYKYSTLTLLLLGSTQEEYNNTSCSLLVLPNKRIYPKFQTLLLVQLASWHIHTIEYSQTIESLSLPCVWYVSWSYTVLSMLNSCLACPHILLFTFLTLLVIEVCWDNKLKTRKSCKLYIVGFWFVSLSGSLWRPRLILFDHFWWGKSHGRNICTLGRNQEWSERKVDVL